MGPGPSRKTASMSFLDTDYLKGRPLPSLFWYITPPQPIAYTGLFNLVFTGFLQKLNFEP